ncbi:MAG: 30S processome protein Utp24 [Candidatus Bathyarchaeota archaeon]|nr:30S processome protein Utp24 [Candidatus Bathyarchaeota archaeon]
MRKVIFDANFLFLPTQFKIDIFSEVEGLIGRFEPIVLSVTIEELKKLSSKGSEKTRRQALLAMEMAKRCGIMHVDIKPEEKHDDVLLRVAKEKNCIVATNDRVLRRKLRENSVATIFLRKGSRLQVEGYV